MTAPSHPGIPLAKKRELVLAAIARIERATKAFGDVEADARSTAKDRQDARLRLRTVENEFGWQWRNVKALLEAERDPD